MQEGNEIKIVTFNDLWEIFIRRLWIILLAVIITILAAFTCNSLTFKPRYSSTAMLYILQQNNNTTANYNDYNEFSLALKVVNDCKQLIKSHSVLEAVINTLELDMNYNQLYESVTIKNPDDTRILQVTVETDDPHKAKEIVDTLCSIATWKITETMGFEQVNFYEYGVFNPTPCNRLGKITYLIIGLIAAIIVYGIFLIIYIADDTISTDEEIEKYLGLSILGDIPNFDALTKKRYGYKYYHRNKYYTNKYEAEE